MSVAVFTGLCRPSLFSSLFSDSLLQIVGGEGSGGERERERERERAKESERESKRERERLTGSFNIDSDMKECVAVIDADTLRRGKAGEIK